VTQVSRLAVLHRAIQAETQRLLQELAGAWSRALRKHGAMPANQIYVFEKLERRTLFSLPPGVTASAGAAYCARP
jgi:hypothetical protein